ncbi:hypothetical protein NLJ89_g5837 [Agrocybe chaxingu]|uniref:Uncharacterized protein n=1 Tax=Agrocybe chaxingu TaxID=84603 RepID=A0A9W8K0A9_9AGAR|nr:hypothetical protein NLJ89_g5837 [Agrocybe chaxingu]
MKISFVLASVVFGAVVSATPVVQEAVCGVDSQVLSESWIGAKKNVKATTLFCPGLTKVGRSVLEERQAAPVNVCGATCNTNCFSPAGGGPDPNECHVIADALRYESENTGAIFQVNNTAGGNMIAMQYRSCRTFFLNQDLQPLAYCRTDWAALIDWIAPNCQATQNAHGGNCVASDQRWVQHA